MCDEKLQRLPGHLVHRSHYDSNAPDHASTSR